MWLEYVLHTPFGEKLCYFWKPDSDNIEEAIFDCKSDTQHAGTIIKISKIEKPPEAYVRAFIAALQSKIATLESQIKALEGYLNDG